MTPFKTPAVYLGRAKLLMVVYVHCSWCNEVTPSRDCRYWQQYEEGEIEFFCDAACGLMYRDVRIKVLSTLAASYNKRGS